MLKCGRGNHTIRGTQGPARQLTHSTQSAPPCRNGLRHRQNAPRRAGADPCPWGSAISRRDMWELGKAVTRKTVRGLKGSEQWPVVSGKWQETGKVLWLATLMTDRLRQPASCG